MTARSSTSPASGQIVRDTPGVSRQNRPLGGTEVAGGSANVEDEIAELGYEQAREALVEVVRALEGGATTLEESLELWERGEALARRCEEWLDGARARLDAALAVRESGTP